MPDSLPWDQIDNLRTLKRDNNEPVVIAGAGLSGCWLARTLAESGINVLVLEAGEHVASAGSSNPIGLFKPYVTRNNTFAMQFYVAAYECLHHRLEQWGLKEASHYNCSGVLQLVETPYPDSTHYRTHESSETERLAGRHIDANALLFENAGWLDPSALCRALLVHEKIEVRCRHQVKDIIVGENQQWNISIHDQMDMIAHTFIMGTGTSSAELSMTQSLATIPARGQLSRFALANTKCPYG